MPHRRSNLEENFGTRLAFAIFDLLATNRHLIWNGLPDAFTHP